MDGLDGRDLHPDGDRFVVAEPLQRPATAPADADPSAGPAPEPETRLLLVRNWFTEMRAALGGGS